METEDDFFNCSRTKCRQRVRLFITNTYTARRWKTVANGGNFRTEKTRESFCAIRRTVEVRKLGVTLHTHKRLERGPQGARRNVPVKALVIEIAFKALDSSGDDISLDD